MKKLIMAIAVVACAAAASAASFDWKTSATGKVYGAGTSTLLASGTAYIFDADAVTKQSVVEMFVSSGTLKGGSLNSKSISNGAIGATNGEAFSWSGGETLNAYFAVIAGDNIFISDSVSQGAKDVGYATFSFSAKAASQAAAIEFKAGDSVSAAGWYTAAAVPEPTSGLLLLLGMAGLALKRKRA